MRLLPRPLVTLIFSAAVFAAAAAAQTTAFTVNGPLTLGPDGGSQFNFTGGGTVTMSPGGHRATQNGRNRHYR